MSRPLISFTVTEVETMLDLLYNTKDRGYYVNEVIQMLEHTTEECNIKIAKAEHKS